MAELVPMRVPVEIAPAGGAGADAPRIFRLTAQLAPDRAILAQGLPDEPDWLRGPLRLVFHVPGDPIAVACTGRAAEVVVDQGSEREHASRCALVFDQLPADGAARLAAYVEARLQLA